MALYPFILVGILLSVEPAFGQTQPAPGWYQNAAGAIEGVSPNMTIYKTKGRLGGAGLTIVWQNSYVYQSDNYWYAEVAYTNTGSQTTSISCTDRAKSSHARAIMRKGSAITGSYIAATETFCSRNPNYTFSLNPGEIFYEWALFKSVPPKDVEISLDWNPYGQSPWVEPWSFGGFDTTLPPEDCKPELVLSKGICQTAEQTLREIPPEFYDVAMCEVEVFFPDVPVTKLSKLTPKEKVLRVLEEATEFIGFISKENTILVAGEHPDDPSTYVEVALELVEGGSCLKVLGVQYWQPGG